MTATYRIGQPYRAPYTGEWWNQARNRLYGTFEAETDREAWAKGQELASGIAGWGPDSGLVLALERKELYPAPRLLNKKPLTMHHFDPTHPEGFDVWVRVSVNDTNPEGFAVWVRVAVGIHETEWPEEEAA